MSPWWRRPTSDGDNDNKEEVASGASAPETDSKDEQPRTEPEKAASRQQAPPAQEKEKEEASGKSGGKDADSSAAQDSGPDRDQDEKEEPKRTRTRRTRSRRPRGHSDDGSKNQDEDESNGRTRTRRPTTRRRPAKPEPEPEPDFVEEEDDSDDHEDMSLETLLKEVLISSPDRNPMDSHERKIALFCDFENIALGVRDSPIKTFDINLVIGRLLEKGKIIVKRAYSDWERYSDAKRTFHEAGIELIDIPQKRYSGKNSADIKLVVDAMDLCYSNEHLDTFVILSGDSDFSPLVSKLKENNKYVIGVGVKGSSSSLLIDNCDEFMYYEDMWRNAQAMPKLDNLDKKQTEVFSLLTDAILALTRENKDVLWGSMIKQTMQRRKPSFNEGYYGYSTFSELLEDAKEKRIIQLKKDKRSGSYIVTGFAQKRRKRS